MTTVNRSAHSVHPVKFPEPPFKPPEGHPRVYFTRDDIPQLLENAHKPQNAKAWARHLDNLAAGTDGVLSPPEGNGGTNVSSPILGVIESYAYEYALRGETQYGLKAIAAINNYVRTVVFQDMDYNNEGQTVFTIGIVYDWCYPLLTEEDKRDMPEAVIAIASRMEIGWPPYKQGAVTGHGPEGQLQRDLMCAAIAMHDEKPELYAHVAGRFFAEFVEAKRFMYPAHMHNQGSHYMSYRFQWEMLTTWIFDRMGLPQVFGPEQQYLLYWALYARRPDGQLLRDGDTHINNNVPRSYYADPNRSMFLAANYFKDPYLKTEALRSRPQLTPSEPSKNQSLNCVELLVFNDSELDGRPFDELPLTHYFPSPKGGMIARTGWGDGKESRAVVAEMKVNEWYFANHQHLDAGSFQIYYKGALATDSGYYQAAVKDVHSPLNEGSTGYGSLYDYNYYKRTIAHNAMTVYDPNETFDAGRKFPLANDGGQRFPNRAVEPVRLSVLTNPDNGYRICDIAGYEFGPDRKQPNYSYLKGDLAGAYSAKVKEYERSFMFLNLQDDTHPAALIVFDRVVSSDQDFKKTWLLHGLEEPVVENNRTVFKDTREGYNGKLTVDTLLPPLSNSRIEKVGGEGKQFWVDGTEYKAALHPGRINEGGGWRIELSPGTASLTDYFLNVLQVGDANPDMPPLPVTLIETDLVAGAQIADRVVIFGKAKERTAQYVIFSLHGEGVFEVTVADLAAGSWAIERNGEPIGHAIASEEGGIALFHGGAGNYRLMYCH